MPKTAVGLFEKPDIVDAVVREIEALGFPRKEIRTVEEPATFEAIGVMSFPRLEFEVALLRELTMIGTTKAEAQAYVEGMQRGGALVLATGSDERVEAATDILNRNGAVASTRSSKGPTPIHGPNFSMRSVAGFPRAIVRVYGISRSDQGGRRGP